MNDASRRRFLSMVGTGAAAGVAVAVVPGRADAAPVEDTGLPDGAEGPMAAYVHDVNKGEVALLVRGHEVVITDKVLTARLVRAYHRAAAKS